MKKVILLLQVLIIFLSGLGQGNPAIKIINLDFKDKKLTLPDDNAKGKVYQVNITNFNPFYYKAVINSSDSSVQIPVNANFAKLIDPTGISSIAQFILPQSGMAGVEAIHDTSAKNFRDEHLYNLSLYAIQLNILITAINDELNVINKEIVCLTRLNKCDTGNIKNYDSTLRKNLNNLNAFITEIKENQKQYLRLANLNINETQRSTDKKNQDENIRKTYTDILDEANKVKKDFNSLSIFQILITILEYRTVSHTFTSLPIYSRKDISNITIEIIPRKENEPAYAQSYKTSFSLPQNQKQIWGVSGGIYISTLKNELYEIDSSTNSHYVIEKTSSDKIEVGFNVMAYTGWRLGKSATFLGPSLGIGLSLESTPRPRVFLGPTLVIGENRRLEISAGIVAGKVYQLNSRYKNIESFTSIPVDFKKDRTKPGAFISIGYTFL